MFAENGSVSQRPKAPRRPAACESASKDPSWYKLDPIAWSDAFPEVEPLPVGEGDDKSVDGGVDVCERVDRERISPTKESNFK
mmetsp:Transcript_134247/g.233290  ORF Transcript_134247/g.233290 Transcript_134247/m.233290 type:complete len:83 (-) Transcript_134247:837-1085(-)